MRLLIGDGARTIGARLTVAGMAAYGDSNPALADQADYAEIDARSDLRVVLDLRGAELVLAHQRARCGISGGAAALRTRVANPSES